MDSFDIHSRTPDQEFLNHSGEIAERASAELRNVSESGNSGKASWRKSHPLILQASELLGNAIYWWYRKGDVSSLLERGV